MSQLFRGVQRPLVVCLGFLGSTPRHVQKYADIFAQKSINTAPLGAKKSIESKVDVIQYIPPISTFFVKSHAQKVAKEITQHLEKALVTTNTNGNPLSSSMQNKAHAMLSPGTIPAMNTEYNQRKILFYCLSNNGAFAYANLLAYLRVARPQLFKRVNNQTAGVIWDSSPSYPNKQLFSRGFVSSTLAQLKMTPKAYHPLLSPLFTSVLSRLTQSQEQYDGIKQSLQHNIPYHTPQLYLHSTDDDLVLYDDTIEYIADRHQITTEWFENPQHEELFKSLYKSMDGQTIGGKSSTSSLHFQPDEFSHHLDDFQQLTETIKAGGMHQNDEFLTKFKDAQQLYTPDAINEMQTSCITDYSRIVSDPALLLDPRGRFHQQDDDVQATLAPLIAHNDYRLFVKNFTPSSHVAHLRRHPDEYKTIVDAFCEYSLRL